MAHLIYPTNEDLFAEDWQIFGKGVLGTGHVKKENRKQYDKKKKMIGTCQEA